MSKVFITTIGAIELLECPFCGSSDLLWIYAFVRCLNCRAQGPPAKTLEKTAAAWNNASARAERVIDHRRRPER